MSRQKWVIIVSVFTILGLLLANCAPAAVAPDIESKSPLRAASPVPTVAGPVASVPKPAEPTPSTKSATSESPRYGGVLARLTDRDSATFDLQREQGGDAATTLFNVYQGLVRFHPVDHKRIMPELAEKWETSPDGRVYTFKFHKDIKWHDGKPFSMDDVAYSLDRMHDPKKYKTISPRGQAMLEAMESAEVAGKDMVKVTTKYPSASFLVNLATGWVPIEPKHIILEKGDMRRDLVGTGPFKLKEFNPNVSMQLVKNPAYYVKGVPYLDGLVFYTIKDAATRFAALRTGRAKITASGSKALSPTEVAVIQKEMPDVIAVYEHDAQARWLFTINVRRKPWDDARVRRAVDLALDRQAFIRINGKGFVGSMFVAPWGMKREEVEKLPGYRQPKDQDIVEAKRLLAEAGFPQGFKTTLLVRAEAASERQALVAKDQLAKIGIDAELIIAERVTVDDRIQRRAFDLLNINWADMTGDPDEALFNYYATGAARNYGDFSDREVDELINKQARTLVVKDREAILAEIERKITNLAPMPIMFWDIYQTGAWKEVKNFSPGRGSHPWSKLDYAWLAR
ncbi:MAG: ABC transporter substrate-binding protein [Chloroflexi bacterium]|nr:ABC transporter substrate-binding protein [Chloroflexota bacterium]